MVVVVVVVGGVVAEVEEEEEAADADGTEAGGGEEDGGGEDAGVGCDENGASQCSGPGPRATLETTTTGVDAAGAGFDGRVVDAVVVAAADVDKRAAARANIPLTFPAPPSNRLAWSVRVRSYVYEM